MVCSYFLFIPGSVLGDCIFLRICPFLLGCSLYLHIIACSKSSLMILWVSVVLVLHFHFWLYWFEHFSFFFIPSHSEGCDLILVTTAGSLGEVLSFLGCLPNGISLSNFIFILFFLKKHRGPFVCSFFMWGRVFVFNCYYVKIH